jgi:hypothetical protein
MKRQINVTLCYLQELSLNHNYTNKKIVHIKFNRLADKNHV